MGTPLLIYLQVLAVCDLHSNPAPVGAVFILTNGISTASRPQYANFGVQPDGN